jgi:hypothetical protein
MKNHLPFTSIAMLRASSAIQDRVTRVENNLKKIEPNWQSEWLFPAIVVGLSNGFDDVSWVLDNEDVLAPVEDAYHFGMGINIDAELLYKTVTSEDLNLKNTPNSRSEIEASLAKMQKILTPMLHVVIDWRKGLHPYTVNAEISADTNTVEDIPATSSHRLDPVASLTSELVKLETADIMAVLTAINSARGGLLKGASYSELQTFLQSMTGNTNLHVSEFVESDSAA